jgi:hypothetical protein
VGRAGLTKILGKELETGGTLGSSWIHVGRVILRHQFSRLFDVAVYKNKPVAEIVVEERVVKLLKSWQRRLFIGRNS